MKRFHCNGKKGYCDRGNDNNIDCKDCEFRNGTGGDVVDVLDTIYEKTRTMREILFRGKTPSQDEHFDDGEWVQGFYTCFNEKEHRIYGGYAETDCGDYYPDWCKVRPETVGQYTGLTDKNGTKIFEGDILEFSDRIVEVFWHTHLGCWDGNFLKFTNKENGRDDMSPLNWGYKGKVIGNIHDNPELLKGEKNYATRKTN